MATQRISDEPAYVLHRHDWSESSLILDVFTRHHGRTALVAKGAKRPHSSLRPVLLPLQPLRLNFGGEAEIRTLKTAEWVGGHVMPTGDALLAGYYLNELLLRLLARDDPHPALFDAYAATVRVLASGLTDALLHPALRAFELLLLREVGFLPAFDMQTLTLAPLQPDARYCLVPEGGLRLAHDDDRASLPGRQWAELQAALDQPAPYTAVLRACSNAPELRTQLRQLLNYHCGTHTLRTRQMMIDLQNL
jgi:DNA repair protein RecO (recombination protein O)